MRAAVVQLLFMAVFIPGLVQTIDPTIRLPQALTNMFAVNWFVNTLGPGLLYYLLYILLPEDGSIARDSRITVLEGVPAGVQEDVMCETVDDVGKKV